MYYRKSVKISVFLFIFLFSMSLFSNSQSVELPVLKTESHVVDGLTYDGTIGKYDVADYEANRNASEGTVQDSGTYIDFGQAKIVASYYIFRAFFFFDTSLIPDNATILNATLSLYVYDDKSTQDFNATIQTGGAYPHSPLESEDYYYIHYSGDGGTENTSTISGNNAYWNISLSETGLTYLNDIGTTKLCLRSSKDINIEEPSGNEYVRVSGSEDQYSHGPKLYLSFEYYVEEEPPASGGDSGNGAKETTLPKITVPSFHIPIWGYYLILGSIALVVGASIFTKPKRSRGSPRGVKVKTNQKRFPKRNKKGRFTK